MLFTEPLREDEERKLEPVLDLLFTDGMGLIPTDTQHAYVTPVMSSRGVRRIYDVKGIAEDERKPLSLLCADLSMASRFADLAGLPRKWYQIIKKSLPGPYTFILQATREVPSVVLKHKSRRRLWERREVGIRIPDCALVLHLTSELGDPLLSSSACDEPAEVWESQKSRLDFVVAATNMAASWEGLAEEDRISTIIDLTMEEPVVRREGMGDPSIFFS